ncbi:MAG TPA: T9SS type A sorting domain-containing protein, partial [Bacteroidales bacterium]|nr:T9SS type A sorting domain-containing protein [Bacteroidales bacterium]
CAVHHFTTGDYSGFDNAPAKKMFLSNQGKSLMLINPSGKLINSIEVFSTDGRVISQESLQSRSTTIPLNIHESGLFMIKVHTQDKTEVFRGIK